MKLRFAGRRRYGGHAYQAAAEAGAAEINFSLDGHQGGWLLEVDGLADEAADKALIEVMKLWGYEPVDY